LSPAISSGFEVVELPNDFFGDAVVVEAAAGPRGLSGTVWGYLWVAFLTSAGVASRPSAQAATAFDDPGGPSPKCFVEVLAVEA